MEDCTPHAVQISVGTNLGIQNLTEPFKDVTRYQQLVASILHLSNITRPDVSYAANDQSRNMENPTETHWKTGKEVLRYLKGTITLGLTYRPGGPVRIVGYSDAYWAHKIPARKSIGGFTFNFASPAMSWRSKKVSIVRKAQWRLNIFPYHSRFLKPYGSRNLDQNVKLSMEFFIFVSEKVMFGASR